MTVKNWTVDGVKVSLQDMGYGSVGIDEGWEGCGAGVNHTQHYVNGTPAVNSKFPDLSAIVKYGHAKQLKVGFYENGTVRDFRQKSTLEAAIGPTPARFKRAGEASRRVTNGSRECPLLLPVVNCVPTLKDVRAVSVKRWMPTMRVMWPSWLQ
jgi:hypothetical protein